MFVMSQDRLFLQEMTGKRLGAYGKYLFIEGESGIRTKVAEYDSEEDCETVLRIVAGGMEARPSNPVMELPTSEEIKDFKAKLDEIQSKFEQIKTPETIKDLNEMIEKILKA